MLSPLLLPFLLTTTLALPSPRSTVPTSSRRLSIHSSSSAPPSSLAASFHGLYGSKETAERIYISDGSSSTLIHEAGWTHVELGPWGDQVDEEEMVLVWIGQAGIASPSPAFVNSDDLVKDGLEIMKNQLAMLAPNLVFPLTRDQKVLSSSSGSDGGELLRVVHSSPTSAIVQIPASVLLVLDMLLPPGLVPVVIPNEALPLVGGVPKERVEYLAKLTKNLKFSPKTSKIVESLSLDHFKSDIRYLTGEDESSPILSRHSFSSTAVVAARWIKKLVEAQTKGVKCTLTPFLPGFTPNVLCEYPQISGGKKADGLTTKEERNVIISGHYDSRGSFGSTRAPGADDDGSGTVQLLGIARALGKAGIKGFEEKVTLAFFAGEEQGLLGSRAFAKELYETNSTVLLQVQADMLAYHDPDEPMQLGFPDLIGTPEAAYLLGNLSHIYSPALVVGTTGACCSDHQSFNSYGFPATQVFERNGGIIDPKYHNSGDLSDRRGFDFEQLREIAKVTFAALLEVGRPVF